MLYESQYYGVSELGDSLYHHGIKGQKWGVRNGPPYPLGASDHSTSEKKAGWRKSLGSSGSDNIKKQSSTKRQPSKGKTAGMVDPVTIATIATYVAVPIVMYSVASARVKKIIKTEKEAHKLDSGNIRKRIKGPHSEKQDMTAINPGYKEGKVGSFMNCTMCTAAYEMRRRGYDVVAQDSTIGRKTEDYASWFNVDKKEITYTNSYTDMHAKLNNQPEGSRGNIVTGVGDFDSRHSMIWEKKKGRVIIRDAQSDTIYDTIGDSIIRKNTRCGYEFYRTDDKEINFDAITDAVKERRK